MKKLFVTLLACVALLNAPFAVAQTPEPTAQVTITVTNFRVMKSLTNLEFVDTTTALAAHPSVTLFDRNGMPTFRVPKAVGFEITIASAVSGETYRPLALYFRQKTNANTTVSDPDGLINFTQALTPDGKITFQHKYLLTGNNGNYEFFVMIQRVSDGAIGLIDPDVETEGGDR